MDFERISKMADKVFAWSITRTFSREEAEELTQEIMFQALKSIGQLRDSEKFESWFWRLADITLKVFRRNKAKIRKTISINEIPELAVEEEPDFTTEQEYQNLRKSISQMSSSYRDIIVMHYYDGLSCKVISQKLNVPEGTVTYRLSLARSKLKERSLKMNEKALKPVKLNFSVIGSLNSDGEDIPFPWQYIDDALSQNILWHAYRQPRTVEELSELTGSPSFYIEERIQNLIKREAVIQPTKKTIQTNFIILDEQISNYTAEHSIKFAAAVSEDFYKLACQLTEKVLESGLQTANRSFDELLCLLPVIMLEKQFKFSSGYLPEYKKIQPKYNGWNWEYIAFISGLSFGSYIRIDRVCSDSGKGNLEHYNCRFPPFVSHNVIPNEVDIYHCILKKEELTEKQKEEAANLIAQGRLVKNKNDEITCAMPVFTKEQFESFLAYAEDTFKNFLPVYAGQVKKYLDGYLKLFPKHLDEAAQRHAFGVFIGLFSAVVDDWIKSGKVLIPEGVSCDALIWV